MRGELQGHATMIRLPRFYTRRTGLLAALFMASVLLLLTVANRWIYHRVEGVLDENLGVRLTSVVRTLLATGTIDGSTLQAGAGGFDENELLYIDPVLKLVQAENELDAILLLDPVDFRLGYSSSDLYRAGSEYAHLATHGDAIAEALTTGTVTVSQTIPVGSIWLKSGFAPIYTVYGDEEIVGILVVEASADFLSVLESVRGVMVSGMIATGLLLLLLMAVYLGLQSQVRRATRALAREDRMTALGRLASQVAHEIRNPVGIIKYSARRMMKWLDSVGGGRREADPELVEMIQYITEESERLEDLTDRYLAYTRHGSLRISKVDARELIESAALALERSEPPAGITIVTEPEEGLPPFEGDPDLLRQVLLNLCWNAVEAMGTEGVITLFARRDGAAGDTGGVAIGVEDTGPGIPEGLRERIFDPFFSTREEGNGLGLYIVEGIISAHGGTVDVETAAEGGARIVLRLPGEVDEEA
jgi:signal transduction histidine kinase